MNPPEPGVYPKVSAAEYHAWDCASTSRLSILLNKSPAHMRHAIEHPSTPTASMRLGTALHMAVLQPDLYATDYEVAQQCEETTEKGKRCSRRGTEWHGAWFCAQHKPVGAGACAFNVLSEEDAAVVFAMKQALLSRPASAKLLSADGPTELSIVWDDAETGVRCKARVDKLALEYGVAIDLKTAQDASPDAFARSIDTYGYARQASHYLHGLAANGLICDSFVFDVVEPDPPHAVGLYRVGEDSLDVGRVQIRRALATYAECERTGVWPSYGDGVQDIELPAWAFKRELEMA